MKHFKQKEFACKCGCGFDTIDPELAYRLDMARTTSGIAYNVLSGCRCAAHNEAEGGSPTSSHKKGKAVDIAALTPFHRFHIVRGLIMAGFKRILIYPEKGFIHADVDGDKHQEVLSIMA